MTEASRAIEQLTGKIDKALATVLATSSPEDRQFILEAAIGAVAGFILNRYAGAYIDKLGLKALAEKHAEATQGMLDRIRGKKVTVADQQQHEHQLNEALEAIRQHGASPDAEKQAEQILVQVLVEAGALRAQAEETAREVVIIVRAAVQKE